MGILDFMEFLLRMCEIDSPTGSLGAATDEAPQPEDDGPLVLFDHFDAKARGNGQCGQHKKPTQRPEQPLAEPEAESSLIFTNQLMLLDYMYTNPRVKILCDQ
jgi:hypothetical protein